MINIAEILKNAPKGTKLYSPIFGECIFKYIDCKNEAICVTLNESLYYFSPLGQYMADSKHLGECLLFPSKEQRDWSNYQLPAPYDFKPFDKVIVRDYDNQRWKADLFSHIVPADTYNQEVYMCVGTGWNHCLPFNEETAKLIGTSDDYNEL